VSDLSVVIPLYDAGRWVRDAISSVLDGADGLREVIVVDDGSTDDGPALARSFGDPVRVIAQANAGPSAARNAGIAAAEGDVLGFLDADDFWLAGTPDPRRPLLADFDVVCGRAQPVVAEPGERPRPIRWAAGGMGLGALLMRRAVVERWGALDPAITHGEDVDWLLRLRDGGARIATVEDVTLGYRLREGSLTRDRAATDRGLASALAASLRRRGMLGGEAR
jgi:glycosyltransferase involved in cell wall biosynthesis